MSYFPSVVHVVMAVIIITATGSLLMSCDHFPPLRSGRDDHRLVLTLKPPPENPYYKEQRARRSTSYREENPDPEEDARQSITPPERITVYVNGNPFVYILEK